jgi:hypothetical protein
MFGCHGVYTGEKIVLILRNKTEHPLDNGIWIATKKEHHASLKEILSSMRTIHLLGNGETNWQNLPVDALDFEEAAFLLCDLILKGDIRIGNVPKPKKRKATTKSKL